MEAITLPVYNSEGQEVDSVKLDAGVFGGEINKAAIYQVVNAYRANNRKGLAATKTRGEVSGGGKKPWKQKGTGRARVGSTRSPLWRHGGVIFGPHPRDFSQPIPERIKRVALKSALSAKVKENDFLVLDDLKLEGPKTKDGSRVLSNLKLNSVKSVLVLLDKMDKNAQLALRNIDSLGLNISQDTNAYEVLAHEKLLITKDGLSSLTKRLKA